MSNRETTKLTPPGPCEHGWDVGAFRRTLLDYYDRHKRDLPWRDEPDPYRVLVSEVMLQQTRVETVLGYYGPWLDRFPDLASLARAEVDEVLQAWEGLGYYRRARNLHGAAVLVRERHEGMLPGSYDELRALPGVGAYTAGAVASIAFGEVVPAPDGNVRRVLARLFDVSDPKPAWLRDTAADLVDPGRPGDWNQALMELGATLCAPRAPRCGACPVAAWCAARAAGTEGERPAAKARKAPRRVLLAAAALVRDGQILLERRPEGGLLAGMWALPEMEVSHEREAAGAVASLAEARTAGRPSRVRALPPCGHRFTHIDATYLPYVVEVGSRAAAAAADTGASRWIDLSGPVDVALPVAQQRILESLREERAEDAA